MKRLTNQAAYNIKGRLNDYIVTIERQTNAQDGTPRYKAAIITKDEKETGTLYNAVYSFRGHYYAEKEEAQFIVDEHEQTIIDAQIKAASKSAGYREQYAIDLYKNNRAVLEIERGQDYCLFRFLYSSNDPFQDANGATWERMRERWVG